MHMDIWSFDTIKEISRPKKVETPFSWVGHFAFLNYLIKELTPNVYVELGTHSGNSYNYTCQIVKENKLNTKCYAVDCWEGDEHAGYYDSSVYENLKAYQERNYSEFSVLKKKYFDEALNDFDNSSIDILHIDGLHTYEAVKHDFYSWLPKLSDKAIVLFHDTYVFERGFGVNELWQELSQQYKGFNFKLSHGLGVLLVGESINKDIIDFIDKANCNEEFVESWFSMLSRCILNDEQYYYLLELQKKQILPKCQKFITTEVFYSDNSHEFSENSKLFKISDSYPNVSHFFKFNKCKNIKNIRVDISFEAIEIKNNILIEVYFEDGSQVKIINYTHNGINHDDVIVFPEDSQIVLPTQKKNIVGLKINFEVISIDEEVINKLPQIMDIIYLKNNRISSLENDISLKQNNIHELNSEIGEKSAEINKLELYCDEMTQELFLLKQKLSDMSDEVHKLNESLEHKNNILNSRKSILKQCIRTWLKI